MGKEKRREGCCTEGEESVGEEMEGQKEGSEGKRGGKRREGWWWRIVQAGGGGVYHTTTIKRHSLKRAQIDRPASLCFPVR